MTHIFRNLLYGVMKFQFTKNGIGDTAQKCIMFLSAHLEFPIIHSFDCCCKADISIILILFSGLIPISRMII